MHVPLTTRLGATNELPFAWRMSAENVSRTNLHRFLQANQLPDFSAFRRQADKDASWLIRALQSFFGVRISEGEERVVDRSGEAPWPRWFPGGRANIAVTCLDRQVERDLGARPAFCCQREDGTVDAATYAELQFQSKRFASALRAAGIGHGDVVAISGQMNPRMVAAMFAVARVGALLVPFFSGLGAVAIAARLAHAAPKAVVVTEGVSRRGNVIGLKSQLAPILEALPQAPLMIVSSGPECSSAGGATEIGWDDFVATGEGFDGSAAETEADAPFLIAYTSGTTGAPKGTVHTHAGLMAKSLLDFGLMFDLGEGDRIMRVTDFGWVTGPASVIAATLLGADLTVPDGAPDFPRHTRLLELVVKRRITIAGVIPSFVRKLMNQDRGEIARLDLSSLRVVTSGAEEWSEQAWWWCFRNICRERIPLVNLTGGTEIAGGIAATPLTEPLKPCSVGVGLPGTSADVVDERGRSIARGESGELVLRAPSVSLTRGLYKDPERYLATYWSAYPGLWNHGDEVRIDADGYWYIVGRLDDMIKVSGKRVSPSEIEEALTATGKVSDAVAIGLADEDGVVGIHCACVVAHGMEACDALARELALRVAQRVGTSFRPKEVRFVGELPRSKSLKLLRRVVRAAWTGGRVDDPDSLANPEVLAQLRQDLRSAACAMGTSEE